MGKVGVAQVDLVAVVVPASAEGQRRRGQGEARKSSRPSGVRPNGEAWNPRVTANTSAREGWACHRRVISLFFMSGMSGAVSVRCLGMPGYFNTGLGLA